MGFTDQDVPDQTGRTFLVTGANTGIGFEVAAVLATAVSRVLLGCRDEAKADTAADRLRCSATDPRCYVGEVSDLACLRGGREVVSGSRPAQNRQCGMFFKRFASAGYTWEEGPRRHDGSRR